MCEKNTSLARAGHGQSVPTVSSILTKLASAQMKKKDIYLIEYKICFFRYIFKRNEKKHLNPHAQMNKKYMYIYIILPMYDKTLVLVIC